MTILRLFPAESALAADPSTEVSWRTITGAQTGHGRSALSALPPASRVELFLPPARVLRASVVLPRGSSRQASKLLPFAMDQILLAEPTEQHLAHLVVGEQCRVAAVQRSAFTELLNTLTVVGRRPRAVWAADALIPADGNTLLWCGNGWARRTGETSQWFDAANPSSPPGLLVSTLTDLDSLTLAAEPAVAAQIDLEQWQAALACPVGLAAGDPWIAPVATDAIDLMQGEFAAGAQVDVDWAKLKPTAILAGSALGLVLLATLGQWWGWRGEERALKQGMNAAFGKAFPGTPVVDAQLQLQAKLHGATNAPAAPVNAGVLTPLLNLAPRLHAGDIKLLGFEYAEGRVTAEYLAKPEQLAAFAQTLSELGKVDTSPNGPDRTRLTVTLHP